MSLLKITVNGKNIIVDAPSKAAAKTYGKSLVEVKVDTVEAADLIGLDVATIHKIEAKVKPVPAEGGADASANSGADESGAGDQA